MCQQIFVKVLRQRFLDSLDNYSRESKSDGLKIVEAYILYMCGEFNISPKEFRYILSDVNAKSFNYTWLDYALEYIKVIVSFTAVGDIKTVMEAQRYYKEFEY